MNFSILMISISLLSVAVPVVAQPQSGGVKPIVQSGCRQGQCWESQVLGTRLVQKTPRGELYQITVGRRSWAMGGKPPSQFAERSQDYVYCSGLVQPISFPIRREGGISPISSTPAGKPLAITKMPIPFTGGCVTVFTSRMCSAPP
jgi:hypothetical protein